LLNFLIKSFVLVVLIDSSKFDFKNPFASPESASQRVYFFSGKTVPKALLKTTAANDLISNGASGSMMTPVR
jgi:hypothetical protein